MANENSLKDFIFKQWDESITPTIVEYIKIPNQSPEYDPEWATNGLLLKAANLMLDWVKAQNVPTMKIQMLHEEKRTPLIFLDVPRSDDCKVDGTILMYGHLDKQPPEEEAWSEGLGPYKPVIRDGKLYGRGGADDGYAIFAAVTAVKALKTHGISHPRIAIVIEAGEESGSPDLDYYMQLLFSSLGPVELVICLDSGCGNYEQFWMTTSLRGIAEGVLTVKIATQGIHSGDGSGIIPSAYRIIRMLLDRLEDAQTGKILLQDLYVDIPKKRIEQAHQAAQFLGKHTYERLPFVQGGKPTTDDLAELLLNQTWRPQLTVIGASGLPHPSKAGNVLHPEVSLKLSVRVPPHVDSVKATQAIKKLLEKDPPYGAHVSFTYSSDGPCNGWESPILPDWLEKSVDSASQKFFHKPSVNMGEGGSIPFMAMLGERFPQASFVITGVLGPGSNAHGPDEFLHLDMGKKVTCCAAQIIADFTVAKSHKH
mmetsp:Transcript_9889/g.13586  ORF Transcript_9889/g.13586 Transcript_9889/m.13586 type:complete len:482 (+) Transcript_9889:72-1517(+)|eukprot:CAMPEP_0168557994 /NCGR_PEP_ID=MMETSP0413-20121227/9729_1 /TAXON_ID=136452 /ORGANISM="Filamoeba nolandi, Strain NC-AS-23-1" /LENGTH=481 /DNA_ID=CAMNT_0008589077 /DNA_START=7 /DNA_END=1452 /DNA_ORIENTATION=+